MTVSLPSIDALMKELYGEKIAKAYKKPKEAHMPNTIATQDLGKAKKERDGMRNRLRKDLDTYTSKYGLSMFEALHAVVDSIVKSTDEYAILYGTTSMPNALCQTVTGATQKLIDAAEGHETLEPIQHVGPPISYPDTEPKTGHWSNSLSPNNKPLPKGKLTPHLPQKLDKDVTVADISGTVYTYSKKKAEISALLSDLQSQTNPYYYVKGYAYLYAANKIMPSVYGTTHTIVKISKMLPYISETMFKTLNLYAPAGYKFRKLKNKPIYKLQEYGPKKQKKSIIGQILDGPAPKSVIIHDDPAIKIASNGQTVLHVKGVDGSKTWLYVSIPDVYGKTTAYPKQTAKIFEYLPTGFKWMQEDMLLDHWMIVAFTPVPSQSEDLW